MKFVMFAPTFSKSNELIKLDFLSTNGKEQLFFAEIFATTRIESCDLISVSLEKEKFERASPAKESTSRVLVEEALATNCCLVFEKKADKELMLKEMGFPSDTSAKYGFIYLDEIGIKKGVGDSAKAIRLNNNLTENFLHEKIFFDKKQKGIVFHDATHAAQLDKCIEMKIALSFLNKTKGTKMSEMIAA